MNVAGSHFDKVFAAKGRMEYVLDPAGLGPKDRKIVGLLNEYGVSGKKCLDIGPGTGRWIQFLRQMGADHICGMDISDQAIKKCRPYCDTIEKVDIEKEPFPFDSNTFDLVTSFEVLEHLYDPMHFLKEICRVITEDGLIIMTTPNMCSMISRIRMIMGKLPVAVASDPTHVRFYRKRDIRGLFQKVNLSASFLATSISLNPGNPKSRFSIPSLQCVSSFDDSLVFYARKKPGRTRDYHTD